MFGRRLRTWVASSCDGCAHASCGAMGKLVICTFPGKEIRWPFGRAERKVEFYTVRKHAARGGRRVSRLDAIEKSFKIALIPLCFIRLRENLLKFGADSKIHLGEIKVLYEWIDGTGNRLTLDAGAVFFAFLIAFRNLKFQHRFFSDTTCIWVHLSILVFLGEVPEF